MRSLRSPLMQCALLSALVALAGCADLAAPRLFHPGTEEYQQRRAERFDPYPLPDVGPEVDGGRPIDFLYPAQQTERSQTAQSFADRFRQPPPPGMFRPPRGTTSRQGILYSPMLPGTQPAPLFVP